MWLCFLEINKNGYLDNFYQVSLSHSEISPDGGENVRLLPKAQMVISINGGSQMRVGLLAVDKSVFFISDGHSLTRDKVSYYVDHI